MEASMSSSTISNPNATQLVAFFRDREDAYKAIDDLRTAGFNNSEIGLAFEGSMEQSGYSGTGGASGNKSVWQKIKDFITGGDDDTAYSSSDFDEGYRHFNFSDDQWKYYRSGISKGGAVVTVRATGTRMEKARDILKDHDADFRTSGFDRSQLGSTTTQADERLQLRGELLRTFKERIAKGEVRLRKEVVSENRTVEVPVTREEVVIERVSADEVSPVSGNVGEIGKDQEIRIPVTEERVRVEKEPVVTGEVRVGKRAVQETQKVSDTVRREELKVEKEGDVNVDDATTKRKKPAA
jgi:uncharacterized protein (TIGR02271 family)